MDLPYVPSCRLSFITTREGERILAEPHNQRLQQILREYNRGIMRNNLWLLPATEETRAFLLALPGALPFPPMELPFRYIIRNNILQREYVSGQVEPEKYLSMNMRLRLHELVILRDMARRLYLADVRGQDAGNLREECAARRMQFISKFGVISDPSHFRHMDNDPDCGLLLALGAGREAGAILRGPLPHGGSRHPRQQFLTANPLPTLEQAVASLGMEQAETDEQLREWGLVPDIQGRYRPELETRADARPPSIFEELYIRPGLPWIGEDIHQKWLDSLYPGCNVRFIPQLGQWQVQLTREALKSTEGDLGIEEAGFGRLLRNIMQCTPTLIYHEGLPDEDAMRRAEIARNRLVERFRTDLVRLNLADEVVRRHDELFAFRPPCFEGDAMTSLPACSIGPESLYPHQRAALRRLLTSRSTFLAHEVGAGKTRVQALAAMEWRRLGLAKRTIITVPSGILEQTRREIYGLYPFARILLLTPGMLQPCNATVLYQTIQGQKPDILLMSHEAFVNLRAPESQRVQVQRLEQEIRARADDTDLTPTMKQRMARWREQTAETRIGLDISCLDVNALIVDEAHLYKSADTRRGKCLLEISRWLQSTGGRIVLASGTPLSNQPQEIFQMQQYLQWDVLQKTGITNLATWIKTFLEPERVPEPSPDGMGYRYKTRLCIAAAQDLRNMFGEVEDQVRLKDCDYIARPVCRTITRKCPVSAEQRIYMRNMALSIASGANPLPLMAKGRLASLCPPLAGLPMNKNGKIMQAAAEMARIYHEDKRAGQLVFMDLGVPKRGDGQAYAILTDLLEQNGVSRAHVVWVQEASSRLNRENVFRRYREGEIRFLIGSTQVLGEGANVQTFTRAIHHMDMPWRPKDLEQRTGRAVRQGNRYPEVLNYYWYSENSLDMFMRATVSRKYDAFVSCFQENEILECCGDRSREIARCRQIAFWPESVDGFTLEPAELREWRNRLNAAFVAVSGIRQNMFKVDKDHVYPARNWPALIITDTREIQRENGGVMKLDGENLDNVPLFVWASGMIDRERTLETLRTALEALNASDMADLSWFAERREDVTRLAQRLETVLPINMREKALAALNGDNDDDGQRFFSYSY